MVEPLERVRGKIISLEHFDARAEHGPNLSLEDSGQSIHAGIAEQRGPRPGDAGAEDRGQRSA